MNNETSKFGPKIGSFFNGNSSNKFGPKIVDKTIFNKPSTFIPNIPSRNIRDNENIPMTEEEMDEMFRKIDEIKIKKRNDDIKRQQKLAEEERESAKYLAGIHKIIGNQLKNKYSSNNNYYSNINKDEYKKREEYKQREKQYEYEQQQRKEYYEKCKERASSPIRDKNIDLSDNIYNFSKEIYDILELEEGASLLDFKKAYRKLLFKYHPDKNLSLENDNKIKQLNNAMDIIRDKYDIK
jgi:hypothetical protein